MSYMPSLLNNIIISQVQQQQKQALGVTHVLPVKEVEPTHGTQIVMDHDRLPPMEAFVLNDTPINGHQIGTDWVYTCWPQTDGGRFHLVGEAGMFAIGARSWYTGNSVPYPDRNITVNLCILEPNNVYSERVLKDTEQTHIFIDKDTSFWIMYRYDTNDVPTPNIYYQEPVILGESQFMVTRVSSAAPGYTAPVPGPV